MNNKKDMIILYTLIIIEILILFNSKLIINDVINSLKIFIVNVFPSLFPTMIISNLLIKNNVSIIIPKFIKKLFNILFNFNDNHTSIFIMSIIAGTPSNALFINEYLSKKLINEEEALDLLCCTHFINPLFIINTALLLFNNIYIGFLIIALLLISNFIKAYILRNNFKRSMNNSLNINNRSFINSLVETIRTCFNAILLILGVIILFSFLTALIVNIFNLNNSYSYIINGFLEITGGLNKLVSVNINPLLKFIISYYFISFGGICIWMQTISQIENKKIKYLKYFIFRII